MVHASKDYSTRIEKDLNITTIKNQKANIFLLKKRAIKLSYNLISYPDISMSSFAASVVFLVFVNNSSSVANAQISADYLVTDHLLNWIHHKPNYQEYGT
jgi:hypothetical protein